MNALAVDLHAQGIRHIVLVPYGTLGLFPLAAIPVTIPGKGERRLGDTDLFEITLSPSARTLVIARQRLAQADLSERTTIFAAGNPDPVPAGMARLEWAQAEAEQWEKTAKQRGFTRQRLAPKDMLKVTLPAP